MFVVAVEQYPMFLAKYVPQLIESLVHLIMGLHNKSSVFGLWGKKVAAQAFRQSVNSDKVVNDKDYYQMVSRAGSFWTLLLGQQGWFRKPLEDFAGIFFETISHYILTLNCSYRTR